VEGMWQMLQYDTPETFVLATGKSYSIKEFVEYCFALAKIPIAWENSGADEIARDERGVVRVRINPKYYRPSDVDCLIGDASKARKLLGWNPSCDLQQLCKLMLESDMQHNLRS
ncbi:MAG: GDP-mannose 4,6-dehydratase, partial [Helicobacter sp.]|nr:GDP-mannose 4,6-dehydratase [Helicobacter sp.]